MGVRMGGWHHAVTPSRRPPLPDAPMRSLVPLAAVALAATAAGAQQRDSLSAGVAQPRPVTVMVQGAPAPSVWHAAKVGMGIGGLAGAAIGGVAGYASYVEEEGCVLLCFSRRGLTAIGAIGGGAFGLVAGGITGAIVGATRRQQALDGREGRVAVIASPTRAGLRVAF